MKRSLPFVIVAAVLAVALLGAWYWQRSASEAPVAKTTLPAQPSASRSNSVEPGANPPHILGDANAPVILEEFGDFECPPCGLLHPVLATMKAEFGPQLAIIFREFPLVPTHAHALVAARAAEAAGLQGKFWEMHDLIYETQKSWHETNDARPIFEGYATRIGLDLEQFKRDMTGEIVARRIFLDGKRGHALGVTGTPTVFLNGREVPFESLPSEKLRPLINAELAAASK